MGGDVLISAERALIGAILLSQGKVLSDFSLEAQDFSDAQLGTIYQTLLEMRLRGEPIDVILAGSRMPNRMADLHQMVQECPTAASARFYADQIYKEAVARRIKVTGQQMLEQTSDDPQASVLQAKKRIDALANAVSTEKVQIIPQILNEHYAYVVERQPNYLQSPWENLNNMLVGFRPGGLYVIGARPSVGKTVVGLQLAYHFSKSGATAFHSLEMSKTELLNRLIAQTAEINIAGLEKHNLTKPERERMMSHKDALNTPLVIFDKSGQTLSDLRAAAAAINRVDTLKAIVVDYLGLMQSTVKGQSRYELTTELSNGLKALARDLQVPVIALAQLNRAVEHRGTDKPTMADLRDSGSIEQDADVVILLHREAVTKDSGDKPIMWLDVAKNRHGKTGRTDYVFQGHLARVVTKETARLD